MKMFLISDNHDTRTGLRLAGVDGVIVHEKHEVKQAVATTLEDESIGLILITRNLISLCSDYIYDIKLTMKIPLIVEIPDRHGKGSAGDSIGNYVRDAVGIKLD